MLANLGRLRVYLKWTILNLTFMRSNINLLKQGLKYTAIFLEIAKQYCEIFSLKTANLKTLNTSLTVWVATIWVRTKRARGWSSGPTGQGLNNVSFKLTSLSECYTNYYIIEWVAGLMVLATCTKWHVDCKSRISARVVDHQVHLWVLKRQ